MGLRANFLDGPLGFGTAPLGNMFRHIPDERATATIDAAWAAGTRYFDTAPFYGAGLAERRLGTALARRNRNEYVVSTKVGRIILPNNTIAYDYTEQGTLRSIEDSLHRLQLDRLDFVWVHDVAQDFHGDGWLTQFDVARTGAFRALTRLRDEGVITGWGLGVNRTEPIELLLGLAEATPDGSLLTGRYTLLDHKHALQRLMPAAERQHVDIVVGGPYSSGMLFGETHSENRTTPPNIEAKVQRITAIADQHRVPLKAAALQFALAHPATVAVIPGASKPARIAEDHTALATHIPGDFWRDLRRHDLVSPDAPLPSG